MWYKRRSSGFTLVELLVVLAIVVLLIALLLPALQNARQVAADVRCGVEMRQTLIAVFTYNGDYPRGMKNLGSLCPYWNDPWPISDAAATTAHENLATDTAPGFSAYYSSHLWDEGRSLRSYWRGYLLAGNYASLDDVGCHAKSYVNQSFLGSFANPVEPFSTYVGFQQSPAFVWYGPGIFDAYQVATYTGTDVAGPGWQIPPTPSFNGPRSILIVCPWVTTYTDGYTFNYVEPPHRPQWGFKSPGDNGTGVYKGHAKNQGFTDGSVTFATNLVGGYVTPQ